MIDCTYYKGYFTSMTLVVSRQKNNELKVRINRSIPRKCSNTSLSTTNPTKK